MTMSRLFQGTSEVPKLCSHIHSYSESFVIYRVLSRVPLAKLHSGFLLVTYFIDSRVHIGEGHGNPPQYSCLQNPHGQRSLASCSPWGRKKWDTIEQLSTAQHEASSINPYLYQLSQLTNLSKTHVSHLYITGVPREPKLAFRDAFVIHHIHRPVLLGIT